MRHRLFLLCALIFCLTPAGLCGAAKAQDASLMLAAQDTPKLQWVELSVGGRPMTIKAGGVLALHPDAPFMVRKAVSDSWLNLGLSYHLADRPTLDLNQYHTLSEIYGDKIFDLEASVLKVFKDGRSLGQIKLVPRLLPIDWLRKAENTKNLNHKIRYTQKAAELTPDNRLLLMRLVDLLLEAKRFKEAANILEPLTKADDDRELLLSLAGLYHEMGQDVKEADTLTRLMNAGHGSPEITDRLISLYEKLGRWQEAAALMPRLLKDKKGSERASSYRRLAEALQRAGREKEALSAWQEAARLNPEDPELWRRLARIKTKQGDKKGLLDALLKAAALNPKDKALHLELAEALLQKGDKAQAALALEKALELSPRDVGIMLRLVKLYQELEDREALALVYENLLEIKKDDPDLHYNLAVLTMEMGDFQQALTSLEAASRLKPKDEEIGFLLLETLIQLKRWDRASKLAGEMLEQKVDPIKLVNLVHDPLLAHRPKKLGKILDLALKASPGTKNLYRLRASLALDLKDSETAIEVLLNAVKNLPDELDMAWDLVNLFEAQKKDKEALRVLGHILDKDPDYKEAQERYLQIKTRLMAQKNHKKPR